jgi:hypothetical protein
MSHSSVAMSKWSLLVALLVWADSAHGHGTPIQLTVTENRLAVTSGLLDSAGFALRIIYENDDDGEPFATTSLPGFGPATIWQLPGYDITGLEENSGLFIEPLARPVAGTDPLESRVLWYWNPTSELVEPAESGTRLQIRKTPALHTTLPADSDVAPPPLQLAAPLAADMGFHNHLVLYAIDEAAPAGAYGFFARLTSNVYEPSEPFLLIFNHGVFDYEQMTEAALAINAAARDSLPGDFNLDGNVDAADYTVWRDGNLGPEKYVEWKAHFGESLTQSGPAAVSATVPEPISFKSVLTAIAIVCRTSSRRVREIPVLAFTWPALHNTDSRLLRISSWPAIIACYRRLRPIVVDKY